MKFINCILFLKISIELRRGLLIIEKELLAKQDFNC